MKRSLDSKPRDSNKPRKELSNSWNSFWNFIKRESLLRTVVFALVLASLLPVFIYGTVSYIRTRDQIQNLVALQLKNITDSGSAQIDGYARSRAAALEKIVADAQFSSLLMGIIKPETVTQSEAASTATLARNYLVTQALGSSEPIFDQVMILDPDGKEVASTDVFWMNTTFGTQFPGNHRVLHPLIQKGNSSSLVYSPFPLFSNRLVLITVRKFKLEFNQTEYTSVGISATSLPIQILKQSASFFKSATAFYYFQPDDSLITSNSDTTMVSLPRDPVVFSAILPIVKGIKTQQPLSFVSSDKKNVLAQVTPVSNLGIYLILEVPTETIFGQIPILDTTNIYMLLFSIGLLTILAYFGTTRVVTPLVHLTQVAHGLSEGNFKLRAHVNRRDEVGQLADSMNHMAVDLATMYTSLEDEVAQRTRQLLTASEVGQMATSSTHLEETLKKTVNLVNERFGYYHTAIYLIDETGAGIILKEASGAVGEIRMRHPRRLSFNDPILASWVAGHNEARIVDDLEAETTFQSEDILTDSRSEAALPISIGGEILGVLDVYANKIRAFEEDAVSVLQTLANQIAGAIQNSRLLVSAQVDLKETTLLYRVTRQIIEAPDENTIKKIVVEILPQISHVNAFLTRDGSNIHILGLYDPKTDKFERSLNTIDIPVSRFHDSLAAGKPVFVEDITRPSDYDNVLSFFLRRGCKSAAILPSLKNEQVSKVLILGFREDEVVDQSTLQPFINLAEVLTSALDKFTVFETLQHHLSELEILANFSRASSSETDLNHLYGVLHEQISRTFGGDVGFLIALLNENKNLIDIPYAFESNELISLESLPLGEGLTSYVLQNKTPLLLVKDTERRAIELGARIVGKPARSWMGVPLLAGGDLVGALILQDQINEERFSEDDLSLFTTLAPQIATAVRNVQLLDDMQKALRAYDDERLLLNTWLDNSPDVVIVKNMHGHYVRASKSISQFFDVTPDQIIGKSDYDLMDPKTASQATEQELDILQHGKSQLEVLEMNSKSNQNLWFMASKIPVKNPAGQPNGLLIIRRDITDMKMAEEKSRRRADEILTAAEIARDATNTLNIEELLGKTVALVSERFNFYHASIFLLDPLGQYAVLRESTGEAGRQLMEMEHKLAVGSKSIVGQATSLGEAVIVADVTTDSTYYPNPLLPGTRAELAIPLKIGARVLGALDVQSTQTGVFTMEDISILGILADQLAVAVNNAELFARTQDMLGKHRLLHQITIAASTSNNLGDAMDRVVNGLVIAQVADRAEILLINRNELELVAFHGFDPGSLPPTRVPFGKGLIGSAVVESRAILVQDTRHDPRYISVDKNTLSELVLPILFGDEILGVLNLESNKLAGFDVNDQEIMVASVNNIGAIIANWRLVNQIRRQVERQEFLFNAAGKIRRSIDVQTILQTSVNEIGKAMGVQRARITLALSEKDEPVGNEAPPLHGNGTPKNGKNGSHSTNEVKG
jgi:PAS domain S-box-containing protein